LATRSNKYEQQDAKIILNYRSNAQRRLARPRKRRLDEAETGRDVTYHEDEEHYCFVLGDFPF